MPSFTKIAWETLLEPKVRHSHTDNLNSEHKIPESAVRAQTPNHVFISPALYITPAPAPIPETSSDPISPSPYVVNHKRRGGRRCGGFDGSETLQFKSGDGEGESNSSGGNGDVAEEVVEDNFFSAGRDGNGGSMAEDGDFFDPRCDSVSVASSAEVDDLGKQVEFRSFVSNQGGEFFDADEDFSSDGSTSNLCSSYRPRLESELRAARLSLLEEIERQKTAENTVSQMCSQCQRLASLVSQTGVTIPAPPAAIGMQLEIDSSDQICQELAIARFVAEAIGKGQARAEAEKAAEVIIESKDQEISRLRDRLQYYEAVNREMTQRKQEAMEVARKQQEREKRNQWRWIWGCVGLSVAIGSSLIVYSYLPEMSKHHSLLGSGDSSDASCITTAESA